MLKIRLRTIIKIFSQPQIKSFASEHICDYLLNTNNEKMSATVQFFINRKPMSHQHIMKHFSFVHLFSVQNEF